ncbi:hypothetical protein M3Y99_01126400 [Aphelenchoides fujianensis]|nr:hypothetical protein M3Y99_01126400 [Aphelenchoides fujianensis]
MAALEGQVVILTGASDGGVGRACALHFLRRGARVAAHGQSEERLKALEADFRALNVPEDRWLIVDGDISNECDQRRLVDKTIEKFGRLDVLINNAAVIFKEGMYRLDSLVVLDQLITSNLHSIGTLNELCAPHLSRTGGAFVIVHSLTTFLEFLHHPHAPMAKVLFEQFARHCAEETKDVRVLSFDPSPHFDSVLHLADFCFTFERKHHTYCKANSLLEEDGDLEKLAAQVVSLLKK